MEIKRYNGYSCGGMGNDPWNFEIRLKNNGTEELLKFLIAIFDFLKTNKFIERISGRITLIYGSSQEDIFNKEGKVNIDNLSFQN